MPIPTKVFSRAEVAKHNKEGDGWLIINGAVYDVSKFASLHPGGVEPLREFYGGDATDAFYGLHRHEVLTKYERLAIGRIEGEEGNPEPIESYAELSKVPFAEPAFFRGDPSPFWTPQHIEFRKAVRKFLVEEVRPEAEAGERTGAAPSEELFRKVGDFGLLGMRLGPGDHLKHCPKGLPLGIQIKDFNYFHELITHEEVSRIACPGFTDGLGSGHCIGAPPVKNFCQNEALKDRVLGECIRGEKRICLAISEPYAGSDVANVRTHATLSPDGKFFVVNGNKKWITQAMWCQYFTTLVRTDGPGMGGLTMLLIERGPGVETTPIPTAYSKSAGTAYIEFNNCMVPVENMLGERQGGFIITLSNFVHERWMIIGFIVSSSRGILSELMKWCNQRKAFGSTLLKQPVVRQRLAQIAARVEACQAWLELLTYEMDHTDDIGGVHISAKASLLKFYSTTCAAEISDIATNLMGGRGITATGLGSYIERFNRTHVYASILGGATDVMADAAIRLSVRDFPQNAKM